MENLGSPKAAAEFFLTQFPGEDIARIPYIWEIHARPKQLPPKGRWLYWFIKCGRRWGKTRAGAEFIVGEVQAGRATKVCIISETAHDARAVMVEGPSGILGVSPPWFRPDYEPAKRLLTWPNGATGKLFSGEAPDQIRGFGFDAGWADEPAKWKHFKEAWSNMLLACAENLRIVITTTPRPIPKLIALLKRAQKEIDAGVPAEDRKVRVTEGALHENMDNLSQSAVDEIMLQYGDTRLGRQEIYGEMLTDNPYALWHQDWISQNRVDVCPTCEIIVVGVDPNASNNEDSDQMGIVVVGLAQNGHHYILGDFTMRGTVGERGKAVARAYNNFGADVIVYEANKGGDWVGAAMATAVPYSRIEAVHASRGKLTRAQPIGLLHEQGKSHFVGTFPELEDELCDWQPGNDSPDRMDALVWAETYLIGYAGAPGGGSVDLTEEYEVHLDDFSEVDLGSFGEVSM